MIPDRTPFEKIGMTPDRSPFEQIDMIPDRSPFEESLVLWNPFIRLPFAHQSDNQKSKETTETMDGYASYRIINFDVVQKSPSWNIKDFGYFLINVSLLY